MKKRSVEEFDDSPSGNAKRIKIELKSAKKHLEPFKERARKAVDRYLDVRDDSKGLRRLNIFHSDVDVKEAQLYGQIPKVTAERRWEDANDDAGRVAGEMLERILNLDIECNTDGYASAMRHCLKDWLIVGLGVPWARYECETEQVEAQEAVMRQYPPGHPSEGQEYEAAPAIEAHERKTEEEVPIDYIFWDDFLWGRSKVWALVPWVSKRLELDRDQCIARFGEELGNEIPLNAKGRDDKRDDQDPWSRAEIWEFWDKEKKKVYWVSDAWPETLDEKDDPLGLEGFFPCPEPLMSNVTTSDLVPEPDYGIAKDLYDGCDELYGRICLLEQSIRVLGIYDKGSVNELKDMLKPAYQNQMIGVDSWAMLAEKGGIKGVTDWFPLDIVVGALDKLSQKLSDKMTLLQQHTGMADIMRGSAQTATTATTDAIKARFQSVRSQRKQDEFALFASRTMQIKAEIISKHFEPESILKSSNVMSTPDAQFAPKAVQLIKDDIYRYRIEVKPEQISMADHAALKQERTEIIQAAAMFAQTLAPLAQVMPGATAGLLKVFQWGLAGFRGASQIEGVFDQLIEQTTAQAQQMQAQGPRPDPAVVKEQAKAQSLQMKGQIDMMKTKADLQADLTRIAAETQSQNQQQAAQAAWNIKEEAAKAQIKQATAMDPGGQPLPGVRRPIV